MVRDTRRPAMLLRIPSIAYEECTGVDTEMNNGEAKLPITEAFELRHCSLPLTMKLTESSRGLRIVVTLQVDDRDTGTPLTVELDQNIETYRLEAHGPGLVAHLLRHTLTQAVQHEIDECLYFNGVRVKDPHKDESVRVVP